MQACHDRVVPRENLRCDWLGTPGTEMLKAEQSGPITERLWNGAEVNRIFSLRLWYAIFVARATCVRQRLYRTRHSNILIVAKTVVGF